MTLLIMLEFFRENGISPAESMGPNMGTLEKRISLLIKSRMNGMIAIMKDIERTQTKPTNAMMQSLFKEIEPIKEPRMIAKSPEEFKTEFENRNKEKQFKKNIK